MFGRISGTIYGSSDKLFVAFFLGPISVGILELFSKIPILLNRFLGLAVSAIIPTVASMDSSTSNAMVKKIYVQGFRIYYLFIIPPILLIGYFSEEILLLWLNSEDTTLIFNMRLMLVWCCIVPIAFGSNILIGLDKGVGQLTIFRILQTVFKVFSLIVLLNFFDIISVPISYFIGCLQLIYLLSVFRNILHINVTQQIIFMLKVIFLSSIPIALTEFLNVTTLIGNNLYLLFIVILVIYVFSSLPVLCIYFKHK